MRIRSAPEVSRIIGVTIALTMLLVACTTNSTSTGYAGYSPMFAATECPGSVMASSTRETRCGYLTVPEDRSNPSGRQIRLFVVRYEPNEPTAAAPVVYAGGDLGSLFDYSAITSMADHLNGPEVIAL